MQNLTMNPYFSLILKFAKVLDRPSLTHFHPAYAKVFLQEENLGSKLLFFSFCKISRNISTAYRCSSRAFNAALKRYYPTFIRYFDALHDLHCMTCKSFKSVCFWEVFIPIVFGDLMMSEAYSEPIQTSKMKIFKKIVNGCQQEKKLQRKSNI